MTKLHPHRHRRGGPRDTEQVLSLLAAHGARSLRDRARCARILVPREDAAKLMIYDLPG